MLERVWDEERDAGSPVLRLETLRRLGGAATIVRDHLARALDVARRRTRPTIATSVFSFLVTPSRDEDRALRRRPRRLRERVSGRVAGGARAACTRSGPSRVEGERYEIFHDVLAEPVLAWRREFEARTAVERERDAAHRRQRRLIVLASGAALLAAAMIALTVYAFSQRGEAGKQRRAAEAQTELALGQKVLAQRRAREAKVQKRNALHQKRNALAQTRAAERAKRSAQQNATVARVAEERAKRSSVFADQEKTLAQSETARARIAATAAKRSAARAKAQSLVARRAARNALVGEYVASSAANLAIEPVKSLRAAVAAAQLESSPRVENALRAALIARRVLAIFDGGGGATDAATFSPDGSLVATASEGGGVRVFRTSTRQLVHVFRVGSASTVAFSHDGTRLLAGVAGKHALLWDVGSGKLLQTLPAGGAVQAAVFAGGDKFIVTGSNDGTVRIWDAQTGLLVRAMQQPHAIHTLAVSRDGSLVTVVAFGDPTARVYSVPDGGLVASLLQQAEVTDAAFSPSGSLLITTGRRNAYVWGTTGWQLQHLLVGHDAALTDVAFPSDDRAVTTSIDSSARVWNPQTGELVFVLASQHQQKVMATAVSPDGTEIATASADRTARIWKTPLGSTPLILAGHAGGLRAVSFSPNGRIVLTASDDGTARLWNPVVPALGPIGSQSGAVSSVSYSPDGRLVLSAGADGTAHLWRTDGSTLQVLHHAARVNSAAFVTGGREILTASDDGTAKLWRVSDGGLIATYSHGAPVRAALAASDGIVTAGADGTVKLWGRDGKLVWSAAHGSPITAAAVSGDVVATGASRRDDPAVAGAQRCRAAHAQGSHRRDHVACIRPGRHAARERQCRQHGAPLDEERRGALHARRAHAGGHVGRVQPRREAGIDRQRGRRRAHLERGDGPGRPSAQLPRLDGQRGGVQPRRPLGRDGGTDDSRHLAGQHRRSLVFPRRRERPVALRGVRTGQPAHRRRDGDRQRRGFRMRVLRAHSVATCAGARSRCASCSPCAASDSPARSTCS